MVLVKWECDDGHEHQGIAVQFIHVANAGAYAVIMCDKEFLEISIDDLQFVRWTE